MFYHEWSRPAGRPENVAHENKTLFGLFFTMKQFANKLDPSKECVRVYFSFRFHTKEIKNPLSRQTHQFYSSISKHNRKSRGECGFYSFRTNNYKFHFFETLTGLRIVLTTEPGCGDLRGDLTRVHETLYVDGVLKSGTAEPNAPFESTAFREALVAWGEKLVG